MLLNESVTEDTVKYFSRMSCKLRHSTNICFTVSGIPQDWQVGGSSPDNKYEWVRQEWPIRSLLSSTVTPSNVQPWSRLLWRVVVAIGGPAWRKCSSFPRESYTNTNANRRWIDEGEAMRWVIVPGLVQSSFRQCVDTVGLVIWMTSSLTENPCRFFSRVLFRSKWRKKPRVYRLSK